MVENQELLCYLTVYLFITLVYYEWSLQWADVGVNSGRLEQFCG